MKRKSLRVTVVMLLLLLLVLGLVACKNDDDDGFEMGFELVGDNQKPMPNYPYYQIYTAYKVSKAKFSIDSVTLQLYFGHSLPGSDLRHGARSDTQIVLGGSIVKQVDNFLSDDFFTAVTVIDAVNHKQKLQFNHSETITLPSSAFSGGWQHISGDYRVGIVYVSIYSEIIDENVEQVIVNPDGNDEFISRGWGASGTIIYFCVEGDKVTIGKDESIYPKGKYLVGDDESSGYYVIE